MKASSFSKHLLAVFLTLLTTPLAAQVAQDPAAASNEGHPLLWLALVTLIVAIAFGVWQKARVQKAKRTNEHSALRDADSRPR